MPGSCPRGRRVARHEHGRRRPGRRSVGPGRPSARTIADARRCRRGTPNSAGVHGALSARAAPVHAAVAWRASALHPAGQPRADDAARPGAQSAQARDDPRDVPTAAAGAVDGSGPNARAGRASPNTIGCSSSACKPCVDAVVEAAQREQVEPAAPGRCARSGRRAVRGDVARSQPNACASPRWN